LAAYERKKKQPGAYLDGKYRHEQTEKFIIIVSVVFVRIFKNEKEQQQDTSGKRNKKQKKKLIFDVTQKRT